MSMIMHPDMVYEYPIWATGLLLAAVAVIGTVLLEIAARRVLPATLRREHNDVAAAIFAIIGVTYAVLLAFVAMLAWEGFNKAKAASSEESAIVLDVYQVASGLAEPALSAVRDGLVGYTRAVIGTEWPAQAAGHVVDAGSRYLDRLNGTAVALKPASQADANLHAMLLQSLMRLRDARQERLLAAETTIPGIVWFVVIVGGALTIAFGSFLGTPSLRMHLAMSSVLAISGVLVLVMIIALSNPFRGDFRVSTAPYERVLAQLAPSGTS